MTIKEGDVVLARLFKGDSYTSEYEVTEKEGTLTINGYPLSLYDEITLKVASEK